MKALAGHSSKTAEEIVKMMPDDFNKKLKEWEQIKDSKPGTSPQLGRKSSGSSKGKKKRRHQDKWSREIDRMMRGGNGLDLR